MGDEVRSIELRDGVITAGVDGSAIIDDLAFDASRASSVKAESNIVASAVSRPMMQRWRVSAMASQTVRPLRDAGKGILDVVACNFVKIQPQVPGAGIHRYHVEKAPVLGADC